MFVNLLRQNVYVLYENTKFYNIYNDSSQISQFIQLAAFQLIINSTKMDMFWRHTIVCLLLCLFAKLLKKLWTDVDEILTLAQLQMLKFWC